jgi:hypothetical protein
MDTGEFRLSRIYSHGWNAAKRLLAERAEHVNAERAAKLNPCGTVEERARWTKGFDDGLRSRTGPHAMSKLRSFRADGSR